MLFAFDPTSLRLAPLQPVDAASAGVVEKQIEMALANRPECIVRTGREGPPLLIIKRSVPYQRMPDIIALDTEGRLVLVECKRAQATRDALAQLLDYAADYHKGGIGRLRMDWASGEGQHANGPLLDRFREFAEDDAFDENMLGQSEVLIVVAAGEDPAFSRISDYLLSKKVPVYLVPVQLFRRESGDLYVEVTPLNFTPSDGSTTSGEKAVWMINTDETHSPGAHERFVKKGVAGIWGYPDGPKTLQLGASAGDTIYAYLSGTGIIARGTIVDGEVRQATPETSVIPECKDQNEWQLATNWTALPRAISNSEVRKEAGAGLPVRNTFCRLWNGNVRKYLARWV